MSSYLIAVLSQVGIYGLLVLSLSLQYGFTGLINFGLVGFYAVGAYTAAIFAISLGWNAWACLAVAALATSVVAIPIGLLTLRLREDYLAIVTLGFAEIIRLIAVSETWLTNGMSGLSGIQRPFAMLGIGTIRDLSFLALIIASLLALSAILTLIIRSPFGRLVRAIRDDEDAVRVLGKEPLKYRLQVLLLGAAIAGLAGAFQAQYIGYVAPDQFISYVTFIVWIALIMGGARSFRGAVIGAALIMVFLEGSRFLRDALPDVSEARLASVRLAVVGLALILMMIFRPDGLIRERRAR